MINPLLTKFNNNYTIIYVQYSLKLSYIAKGFVVKLAPPHVQSAWGFRGERIRTVGLAACCNSLSSKWQSSLN